VYWAILGGLAGSLLVERAEILGYWRGGQWACRPARAGGGPGARRGRRQKPTTLSAQTFRSTNFVAGASCADFLLASVCSDTPRAPAQGAQTQIGTLSPTAFWITSLALGIPMP